MFLLRSVGLSARIVGPTRAGVTSASELVRAKDRYFPAGASKKSARYHLVVRTCSSTARLPEIEKLRPDLKTHQDLHRFSIEQVRRGQYYEQNMAL